MVERFLEQTTGKGPVIWKHQWVPYDEISPNMTMAVIASEDNLFPYHHGFDVIQIEKAINDRIENRRRRGASTISQQTAKNVFLWPASSWVRKGFEVYFTFLIETFWSKERIMEVYLNSIEMGHGLYGVQATAKYKFDTTARDLTKGECALIAASLPNPLIFDSANPTPYMMKRKRQIVHLMSVLPKFPQEQAKKKHKHHRE